MVVYTLTTTLVATLQAMMLYLFVQNFACAPQRTHISDVDLGIGYCYLPTLGNRLMVRLSLRI